MGEEAVVRIYHVRGKMIFSKRIKKRKYTSIENNCAREPGPEDTEKCQVTVFIREPGRWDHGRLHF